MVRSREETSGEAGEYMGMSRGGNIRRSRGIHGNEQGRKHQEKQGNTWG